MRPVFLALCVLFLFGTAHTARAYWDDSVIIEIGGGLPLGPSTSTPPQGDTGIGTGGGNSGTGGAGSGGSTGGGGSDAGSAGGTGGGSGSGGTSSGGNSSGSDSGSAGTGGNAGGSAANSGGDSSSGGDTPPPDDSNAINDNLFDLLVAQGAITGGTQNSSSGQDTVNSSVGSGGTAGGQGGVKGGGGGSAGGGGNITINATKLRAALRGNDSFRKILDDFSAGVRGGTYQRGLSQYDVGLMAASTVLEDINIDELTFGATKFEMVYRSRGYLLGFIPKTFPVRIAVNPQASVASDRLVLSLPWYRFFIRKLFSPSVLAREIDAVVTADVRAEGDTSGDVQARLFEAVSNLLGEKVGTVAINQ